MTDPGGDGELQSMGEGDERGLSRVLCELVAEVSLNPVWTREPALDRNAVLAGLVLFDLLCQPRHVVRTTETLRFADALTLRRSFRVDVAFDRLSEGRERDLQELSSLSGRPSSEVKGRGPARRWTPLMYVARPMADEVDVEAVGGGLLPRPSQRAVRGALEAALWHLLWRTLRDTSDRGSLGDRLLHRDDLARWTLQAAILAVCESGIASAHSQHRIQHLLERAAGLEACPGPGRARLGDLSVGCLASLADEEPDEHKALALQLLAREVSRMRNLLDRFDLVYRNYVIVAGLDPAPRTHSVSFDLLPVAVLPTSDATRFAHRTRRMLDPREHNFTARLHVPLPGRATATGPSDPVRASHAEYGLDIVGPHDETGNPETSIYAMARANLAPRPVADAVATLRQCRDMLAGSRPDGPAATTDATARSAPELPVVFVAFSHARPALWTIRLLTAQQESAAKDLATRWAQVDRRAEVPQLDRPRSELRHLSDATDRALHWLENLEPALADAGDVVDRLAELCDAFDEVIASTERGVGRQSGIVPDGAGTPRAPDLYLLSEDFRSHDVGRIRVSQPLFREVPQSEVTSVDVWVTMRDEDRPYAPGVVVPPAAVLVLVWVVAAFLFRSVLGPFAGAAGALERQADAIVAVLLLLPGIALTQVGFPKARSIRGVLRRASRWQAYTAVAVLGFCAIVLATSTGVDSSAAGSGDPAGADRAAADAVVWSLRGAAIVFGAWLVWSLLAWGLRGRYVWLPKGMSHLLGGGRRWPWPLRLLDPSSRLHYDTKRVDAEFDLVPRDADRPGAGPPRDGPPPAERPGRGRR